MKKEKLFKILVFLFAFMLSINVLIKNAEAESNRENLKKRLEEQEEILENEMKPIDPLESEGIQDFIQKSLDKAEENMKNSTGTPDFMEKSKSLQKFVFKLIINTRTIAIYTYIGVWVIGLLYAATYGSRDVNKRRKVYLWIRNSTILFFVYINIPLFIIWLSSDKSKLTKIVLFNSVYSLLEFLRSNSLIISSLMSYDGLSKKIIGKNDLPMQRQGRYLLKFAVIVFIFLNIAPFIMSFLV